MFKQQTLGLIACLLLTMTVGCSSNSNIIRGQSPQIYQAQQRAAYSAQQMQQAGYPQQRMPQFAGRGYAPQPVQNVSGYFESYEGPQCANGSCQTGACEECEECEECKGGCCLLGRLFGCNKCQDDCNNGCCLLGRLCPFGCLSKHNSGKPPEYNYHYKVHRPDPSQLRYPQAMTQGAVVQYPYYTVKGPDDFFYKD